LPCCFFYRSIHVIKEDEDYPNGKNGIVQFVYTSDLHYGESRHFRGDFVEARDVNQELVRQINKLPEMTFPNDGGVNAGRKIEWFDYLIINGDISNLQKKGPPQLQPAATSWTQITEDFMGGITLKNYSNLKTEFLLECGNHDVSNTIGHPKPTYPLSDPTVMVNLFNRMLCPSAPETNLTYNYRTDKINYSRDIVDVHLMFVNIWPDSVQRIWMEKDLAKVDISTPVIIFTHDQPDCEAKHFTNPNGSHDVDIISKFENVVDEVFKTYRTIDTVSIIEQRAFVSFLKVHKNIKAYFHGNDNRNEFYFYKGPDNDINLNVFRVDSPMKETITGLDAKDEIGDETKLSFQTIVLDGNTRTMTVRECLWNTSGATSPVSWGASSTVSLE
jgi:hypothetical protein